MSDNSKLVIREHDQFLVNEHCKATSDPLSDILDWLGHADLADDIIDNEMSITACSSGGTHTPFFGTAASLQAIPGNTGEDVLSQTQAGSSTSRSYLSKYCNVNGDPNAQNPTAFDLEEEEWDARQRQTGATGRLVSYDEEDCPNEDFILRGGHGRRVVVTHVTEGGIAAHAGVRAGDVLVSIDGRRDFNHKSVDALQSSLIPPVTLVFMGFVGKLQAEVRLQHKQKSCGLSSRQQVFVGSPQSPATVADEVIFRPGSATLFLATMPQTPRGSSLASPRRSDTGSAAGDECETVAQEYDSTDCPGHGESTGGTSEGIPQEADEYVAVYELRGHEARNLLTRALSRQAIPEQQVFPWHSKSAGDHAQVPRTIIPSPSPLSRDS